MLATPKKLRYLSARLLRYRGERNFFRRDSSNDDGETLGGHDHSADTAKEHESETRFATLFF